MKLNINPCQVTSLSGTATPNQYLYKIGTEKADTFALSFNQNLACGYAVNVEMVDTLPEFITYNTDKKDFSVFSENIAHAGTASYKARASVQVPKDYTKNSFEIVSTEITL